ncbi:PREDICTED: tetraspanin-8-like [Nicotiana attenuata]|uniref:Tetraspanin-8 n=1 Tax=Nicotiana attenuata TaxID=49451 RepID=A0A314L2B9_NICAT|nr:PREDICTED: tetraspanin-8-like [Nicotiana attenuata]OIT35357.1 tetraspanin-8 [Nicotiana attenuata]
MVRCSNCFITTLNFFTLVASLILILVSVSFNMNINGTVCQKTLQKPLLILGLFLLILSLMGIIGACCHVSFLLYIYLALLFVVLTGMIIYQLFCIVNAVTHLDSNNQEPKGEWEDKFQEYSHWFIKKRLPNDRDWEKIKSCLIDAKYCKYQIPKDRIADFYKNKLSSTQSGCCKPPTYCNFEFQNATTWIVPKTGAKVPDDADCKAWNNEEKQMCYNCNSCKKAVIDNIKKYYKHSALISFCIFLIISIIYSVGCCALTNNSYRRRAYVYHGYRPHGPGPYGYP